MGFLGRSAAVNISLKLDTTTAGRVATALLRLRPGKWQTYRVEEQKVRELRPVRMCTRAVPQWDDLRLDSGYPQPLAHGRPQASPVATLRLVCTVCAAPRDNHWPGAERDGRLRRLWCRGCGVQRTADQWNCPCGTAWPSCVRHARGTRLGSGSVQCSSAPVQAADAGHPHWEAAAPRKARARASKACARS